MDAGNHDGETDYNNLPVERGAPQSTLCSLYTRPKRTTISSRPDPPSFAFRSARKPLHVRGKHQVHQITFNVRLRSVNFTICVQVHLSMLRHAKLLANMVRLTHHAGVFDLLGDAQPDGELGEHEPATHPTETTGRERVEINRWRPEKERGGRRPGMARFFV